jgi:hypothetical protein
MARACSTYGDRERRGAYRVLVERPEECDHLKDLDADERIILKWIFKKRGGSMD